MKTPFTVQQFFDVFKNYNQAVFPVQVVFYAMGILALYLALKPTRGSGKIISGLLFLFWFWMGIVYHFVFFTAINKAAYGFGALFIVQGILFLIYGVFQNKMLFRYRSDMYGITGIMLIGYALVVYPVLGYFMGHVYPASPTFGLPCPTTIFTFGLLLLTDKKFPVAILIIPVIWSVIGFTATFVFGILEDAGLIIAALAASFLLANRNRLLLKKMDRL